MREIKFRGKIKGIDKWAYGYYLEQRGRGIDGSEDIIIHHIVEFDGSFQIVDPKTVGQWTGLKDKNGVDIYEGDRLTFQYLKDLNNPILLTGSFFYNDDELRYEIDIEENHDEYVCLYYINNGMMYNFEVIGSIHQT
jgi:uncharacterized phage protein (TIGR01671 family)